MWAPRREGEGVFVGGGVTRDNVLVKHVGGEYHACVSDCLYKLEVLAGLEHIAKMILV